MPEGPSIIILKDALTPYKNKRIIKASGTADIDFERMRGQVITSVNSWGKHLLICFKNFFIRIHLMMFGSYRIDDRKAFEPRLRLSLKNGEINFYTCQVKLVEGQVKEFYDWQTDIMSGKWEAQAVIDKMQEHADEKICDVLLDQDVFTGVGNIIKNESLFKAKIHPESISGTIPKRKINELLKKTRAYAFDFYRFKNENSLKKHWLVYEKTSCPRCKIPLHHQYLGKNKRLSFYCNNCQILYANT